MRKTAATITGLALAAALLTGCDSTPSYGGGGWYPVFFPQPQPEPRPEVTRYSAHKQPKPQQLPRVLTVPRPAPYRAPVRTGK